ncbi:MAG TPA: hypothetical protein VHX38_02985 [Pseudonocardiaceae bacterium]|jgi:hypothetical protein|nr:hypothetical protein [Pseudonocardiaceae bacterium]
MTTDDNVLRDLQRSVLETSHDNLRADYEALLAELLAERDEARSQVDRTFTETRGQIVQMARGNAAAMNEVRRERDAARARVDALEARLARAVVVPEDATAQIRGVLRSELNGHVQPAAVTAVIKSWRGVATQPAEPPSPDFAMRAFGPCTEQGSHHIYGELFDGRCDVPGHWPAPATQPAEQPSKVTTLHVTATREVPDGHTHQRVRYEWEGDSWEGWLISYGTVDGVDEAYVLRDDGKPWVVLRENVTEIGASSWPHRNGCNGCTIPDYSYPTCWTDEQVSEDQAADEPSYDYAPAPAAQPEPQDEARDD